MTRFLTSFIFAAVLAACGDSTADSGIPPEARRMADILSGNAAGKAADNPLCKLFSPADLAAYVGEALHPGHNAVMGMGCQWMAKDGTGDVIVQAVAKSYHVEPSLADGYAALPEMGSRGYVAPHLDGWMAAAIVGEESIGASVAGKAASAAAAQALLREAIKRRAGSGS